MKYAMVVPKEFLMHYESTPFEISGLLNWARAMGGDIKTIDDDLSGYDVLHCNLSSTELHYPHKCRMENPDAVIVGNLDFAIDILQLYFVAIEGEVPSRQFHSSYLLDTMKEVDILLSVEPVQAKWLQTILGDVVHVQHVPHPTDVGGVMKYVSKIPRVPQDPCKRTIGVMWHQYEHNHILPLQVINATQRELKRMGSNIELYRKLMGIKPTFIKDRGHEFPVQHGTEVSIHLQGHVVTCVPFVTPHTNSDGKIEFREGTDDYHFWDSIVPYQSPMDFYQEVIKSDVALDLYSIFSLGRYQMDCAICGIPSVVSDRSYSGNRLYPHTKVSLREPKGIVDQLVRVLTDEEYATEVRATAKQGLEEFDLERSKKTMTELVKKFLS